MAIINPPAWLQFRTDHPAALYRRQLKGLLGGSTALSGIASSGDLAVTQATTANMTVRVATGGAFILGTESTTFQGAYYVHNDASVTLTVPAADPSLSRYDLIVLQVRDQEYSGTSNDAVLSVVQGVPAAAPAEPAAPANSIVLARVTVGAGATTVTSANIVDRRARVAAPPLVAASATARTAMNLAREGQLVFRSDLDVYEFYDGTTWQTLRPFVEGGTQNIVHATWSGNFSFYKIGTLVMASGYANMPTGVTAGQRVVVPGITIPTGMRPAADTTLPPHPGYNTSLTYRFWARADGVLEIQRTGDISTNMALTAMWTAA